MILPEDEYKRENTDDTIVPTDFIPINENKHARAFEILIDPSLSAGSAVVYRFRGCHCCCNEHALSQVALADAHSVPMAQPACFFYHVRSAVWYSAGQVQSCHPFAECI